MSWIVGYRSRYVTCLSYSKLSPLSSTLSSITSSYLILYRSFHSSIRNDSTFSSVFSAPVLFNSFRRSLHATNEEISKEYWQNIASSRDVYSTSPTHGVRQIYLNRPQSLNAINLSMVEQLSFILSALEKDKDIAVACMSGIGGKAFCAGGDIVAIHNAGLKRKSSPNGRVSNDDITKKFFKEEYKLNFKLSHVRIPFIPIMNGITSKQHHFALHVLKSMGGGVGLSCHSRFRVATPETLLAMPECAIGFFPDVGSSYILSRLYYPKFGLFLALTGYRLKGYDLVHVGLASHYCIDKNYIRQFENWFPFNGLDYQQAEDAVENIFYNSIHQQSNQSFPPPFSFTDDQLDIIQTCFSHPSIELIMEALKKSSLNNKFSSALLSMMESASPTSLKVTLRLFEYGATHNLVDCLKMDYRLSQRFLLGDDFYSGVNSMLIKKDRSPKWSQSLNEITDNHIEQYFEPFEDESEELMLNYPQWKEQQWYI